MKRGLILLIVIAIPILAWTQNAYENNIGKANNGDPDAQNEIGKCYLDGNGVNKDSEKAFMWFMKAAKQGYVKGQHNVGVCYYNGNGVDQNRNEAFLWFKKAADQGYPNSEEVLGTCYFQGQGVEKDNTQGFKWYMKAANQGFAKAQDKLARCYYYGRGVDKDYVQAAFWYRKAAEQNYALAQSGLGFCYYNGHGVEKDYSQAVNLFRKAAAQGEPRAQWGLGYCYYEGQGIEKDIKQAEYWIGKAAENGDNAAISFIPKVLAKVNEQENEKHKSVEAASLSKSVDENIPTIDKVENNYYAVIIGNEKYQNEVEVPFAENDAKIFKDYVKQTLGVPEKQIKYIANGTLNGIRLAVKWLSQAMEVSGSNNQALFYYAGHGIPDEASKSAYLLPVDGIGSDPESAYSLEKLYGEFEKMQAKRILVFLDACFSGAKREEGMLASARGVAIKTKPATPKGNMIVFTAAQGEETAYPYKEQHHGMFTYFLLRKLQMTNGDVTLGDLAAYLQDEVKRQSFVENNKMQTPTVIVSQSIINGWKNMNLK